MRVTVGNGGWVEVEGLELPGRVYARFQEVDGQVRMTELYVDGDGKPIQAGAVRRLPVTAIEQGLSDDDYLKATSGVAGPDLSRLAASYTTTFASSPRTGGYKGRHCEHCDAPLRGREGWAARHGDREQAVTDWVELSWLAQYGGGVPLPKYRTRRAKSVEPEELKLSAPEDGLTDAFLADVARAYRLAVERRLPPATALAEASGANVRTVQSWVYKARKRGIMPAAVKRGRIV